MVRRLLPSLALILILPVSAVLAAPPDPALARARDKRVLNTSDNGSRSALRIRDEVLKRILE